MSNEEILKSVTNVRPVPMGAIYTAMELARKDSLSTSSQQDESMNIPEEIKEKILLMGNAYANVPGFAKEYRYDAKKAMDFYEGAMKGYSLALPELEELRTQLSKCENSRENLIIDLAHKMERIEELEKNHH